MNQQLRHGEADRNPPLEKTGADRNPPLEKIGADRNPPVERIGVDQNPFRHQVWLECAACGHRIPFDRTPKACEQCGGEWIDARYDYDRIRELWPAILRERPFNMWRYQELLPLRDSAHRVTMGEGGTPLLHATNLGLMLGCPHIYVKDERQGPTGSFKDRQASLAISVMKEQAVTEAVVASTGNVAISYSAYSALAGIKMWAFLTSLVPSEKMREVAL